MPSKTAPSPNGVIDFSTWSPAQRRYEWFAMDREDGDDGEPFRVKVRRLTTAEVEAVPMGKALIKEVVRDYRACIVAWSLTACTPDGAVVPVPPPAELDPDSVIAVCDHILTVDQLQFLYQTLKAGDALKLMAEKKALIRSATTPASPPEHDSAGGT